MEKELVLVLGGARSGKTRFAQHLAESLSDKVLYVATAEALDGEMQERIEIHKKDRPGHWRTVEATHKLGEAIARQIFDAEIVIIDCLTLLLSNLLGRFSTDGNVDTPAFEASIETELGTLLNQFENGSASFIIVSNEIGMGVVPADQGTRLYRDTLGRAHQALAEAADEVYLVTAGIPLALKKKSTGLPSSRKAPRLRQGLIQVYTGNGKGKTTAALGLALRASGRGLKVSVVQFLKANDRCGEHVFAERHKAFEIIQPAAVSAFKQDAQARRETALRSLEIAREKLAAGNVDVLILDEILTAASAGALSDEEIESLSAAKPPYVELVLTGRGASEKIIQWADLVTEMKEIKHPFRQGIMARIGIEY